MGTISWPEPIGEYLRQVRRELAGLPGRYRDEVLSGLAEHANDRFAEGDDPVDIVALLGDPAEVAAQAAEEYAARGGRPGWRTPRRVAQLVALVLALAASAYALFLLPGSTQVEVIHIPDGGIASTILSSAPPLAWSVPYSWVYVAAIPLLLVLIPLLTPLFTGANAGRIVTIVIALLLVALAAIASASIGWLFLPAAIAEVVAACLPERKKARR